MRTCPLASRSSTPSPAIRVAFRSPRRSPSLRISVSVGVRNVASRLPPISVTPSSRASSAGSGMTGTGASATTGGATRTGAGGAMGRAAGAGRGLSRRAGVGALSMSGIPTARRTQRLAAIIVTGPTHPACGRSAACRSRPATRKCSSASQPGRSRPIETPRGRGDASASRTDTAPCGRSGCSGRSASARDSSCAGRSSGAEGARRAR